MDEYSYGDFDLQAQIDASQGFSGGYGDVPGYTSSPAEAVGVNSPGWTWSDTKSLVNLYGTVRAIDAQSKMPIYPNNAMPITLPDGSMLRNTWVRSGPAAAGGNNMLLLLIVGALIFVAAR